MLDSVDAAALKVPIVSVFEFRYCLFHTSAINENFRVPFCLTAAMLMDKFNIVAVLPKCTGAVRNSNVTAQICGPWRRRHAHPVHLHVS